MKKHLIFLLSVILTLNYLNLAANDYIYSEKEQKTYTTNREALCNFRFVLENPYGFGWPPDRGIVITVDGVDYGFLNLAWGSSYAEEIVALPSGEVQFSWVGGFVSEFNHFEIYNSLDELIYTNTEFMGEGVFLTYQNECVECIPITDLEGVYIPEEDRVNLNWKSPESDDLKGFDIYRNDVVIEHLPPTTTSYSENTEELENGTYKYCVVPVYPYVCSLEDECFEISIGCLPITDLKGEYIAEKHQIKLSWKAPESADVTGFDVYRNDELIEHLTPTTNLYSENTEKLENGDYKYCVLPVYPFECTFEEKCFEISINVSIVDYKNHILIYPNPATHVINITGDRVSTVRMYNNIGQLILTQHNTNTINVSALQNGIYLLTIETSTGSIIQKKIIVNH